MLEPQEVKRYERHVDALCRMAASDDPTSLADLFALRDRLTVGIALAAVAQVEAGFSWAEVAAGCDRNRSTLFRWVQRKLTPRSGSLTDHPTLEI